MPGGLKKKTYNTVSMKTHLELDVTVKTVQFIDYTPLTTESHFTITNDVEYKNMIFFIVPGARDNKIAYYEYMADKVEKVATEDMAVDTTVPG